MSAIYLSSSPALNPSVSSQERYNQAIRMLKYRLDTSNARQEAQEIVTQIDELRCISLRGVFNLNNLRDIWTDVQAVNAAIKELLDTASKESLKGLAACILSDLKNIAREVSSIFHSTPEEQIPSSSSIARAAFRPRSNASLANLSIPPEEACPLITEKLSNPNKELSTEDSINLLVTCIEYGEFRAEKVKDKQTIIVLGNTGSGKSTFINYVCGCEMERKEVRDLVREGCNAADFLARRVVRVKQTSAKKEVTKIGHSNKSQTFMPEVVSTEEGLNYCDCPGFLDNRAVEIDIANAVNTKRILEVSSAIKVIILVDYSSLEADKGRGLSEMIQIACRLFGSRDNLVKHKKAILLGVSKVPGVEEGDDPCPLEELQEQIRRANVDNMTKVVLGVLSERLFIYDPTNRKNLKYKGTLEREALIEKISSLKSIDKSANIFQTPLDRNSEPKLMFIAEKMMEQVKLLLHAKDFKKASSFSRNLSLLQVIGQHPIQKLISENSKMVLTHFMNLVSEFKRFCERLEVETAKSLLAELDNTKEDFGFDLEIGDLNQLEELYKFTEERKKAQLKIETFKQHCQSEQFDNAKEILIELRLAVDSSRLIEPYLEQFKEFVSIEQLQTDLQTHQNRSAEQKDREFVNTIIVEFEACCQSGELNSAKTLLDKLRPFDGVHTHMSIHELRYQESESKKKLADTILELKLKTDEFKECCKDERFSDADLVLESLEKAIDDFELGEPYLEELKSAVKIDVRKGFYQRCKERYEQRIQKEQEAKTQEEVDKIVNDFDHCCKDGNLELAKTLLDKLRQVDAKYVNIQVHEECYQICESEEKLEEMKMKMQLKLDKFVRYCQDGDLEAAEAIVNRIRDAVNDCCDLNKSDLKKLKFFVDLKGIIAHLKDQYEIQEMRDEATCLFKRGSEKLKYEKEQGINPYSLEGINEARRDFVRALRMANEIEWTAMANAIQEKLQMIEKMKNNVYRILREY